MANDIFISYSRKDQPSVEKLDAAIRETGIDPWVDWEDIPLTADWWAEIQRGIEGAHTFIFNISPDSVSSEVCAQELEYAVEHNKRIVSLLVRDVAEAPPLLPQADWIPFRETDDFEASFNTLKDILYSNLDWIEPHTRLTVQAVEWQLQDENDSFLLHGEDLKDAKQRLTETEKEPPLTNLHVQFIATSQQNAIRRQRRILAFVALGLLVATILGCVTLFNLQARRQQEAALALANAESTTQAQARATAEAIQATAEIEAGVAAGRARAAQTAAAVAQTAEAEAAAAEATAQSAHRNAEQDREAAVVAEQTAQAVRAIAQTQQARAEQGQVEAIAAQQTAQVAEQQASQAQQVAQAGQATAEAHQATAVASQATALARQNIALAQQAEAEAAAAAALKAQAEAEALAEAAEKEKEIAEQAKAEAEAAQSEAAATAVAVKTVQAQVEQQIAEANALIDEALLAAAIAKQVKVCSSIQAGEGITFDNQNNNVWVATSKPFGGDADVLKFSVSDCQADPGVPPFSGNHTQDIVYGGNAVWVSDIANETQKRDPVTGAVIKTIPRGGNLLYAADKVWIIYLFSGTVYEVDPNNNDTLSWVTDNPGFSPFPPPALGDVEFDMAYDGNFIWVTDRDEFALIDPTKSGAEAVIKGASGLPNNEQGELGAISVISARNHIWMAANDKIFKFQPQDPNATLIDTFTIPGKRLFQLVYDGTYFWASTYATGEFIKIDPTDGTVLATITTAYSDNHLLTFAEGSLWAVPWWMQHGSYFPKPILKIPVILP